MKSKRKTIEENSKAEIAKRVITPTQKYFIPGRGTVDAASLEEAIKQPQKEEVEDGN